MPGTLSRRSEGPHNALFGSGLTPFRMRTYDLFHSARRGHQWSPAYQKVPALFPPPDKQTIRYVVNRAAAVRRQRYQDDERYRHFTEAALLEQVCGVEGLLRHQGDG
jgi:hypothetical protein